MASLDEAPAEAYEAEGMSLRIVAVPQRARSASAAGTVDRTWGSTLLTRPCAGVASPISKVLARCDTLPDGAGWRRLAVALGSVL